MRQRSGWISLSFTRDKWLSFYHFYSIWVTTDKALYFHPYVFQILDVDSFFYFTASLFNPILCLLYKSDYKRNTRALLKKLRWPGKTAKENRIELIPGLNVKLWNIYSQCHIPAHIYWWFRRFFGGFYGKHVHTSNFTDWIRNQELQIDQKKFILLITSDVDP